MAPSPNDPAHPIIPVRVESLRPSPIPPTSRLDTKSHYGPQTSSPAPALAPPPTSAQPYKTVTSSSKPPKLSLNIPPTSPRSLPQPNRPVNLSSQNADSLSPPALSQESGVLLPLEALRYMARIGGPPAQSPPVSSFKFKSVDARSGQPLQGPILETKNNKTQTNSVEGEPSGPDESVHNDATDSESWLPDEEFEEDQPSSRGVEGFPTPPTFRPPVAPSMYSLSIVPDVRSEYSFSL